MDAPLPPHRPRRGLDSLAVALLVPLVAVLGACGEPGPSRTEIEAETEERVERVMRREMLRLAARADSVDDLLQPVPLLRPGEESALRRYLNARHLEAARRLGVGRPESRQEVQALEREGRLVELEDSTGLWMVRELDHSVAAVTPDTRALVEQVATRFQERLDSMGLPPYRIEISSVLRTAESQADLRSSNVNAARGVSTHEFGTTLDIAYNGFAAPSEPLLDPSAPEAPRLEPLLTEMAASVAENVAARRSRELQAILGRVLREMQEEGRVLVTLERQQPVYHVTVGRALASE